MKLILSRKGFDSSIGGVASPIFSSGRLLSLPIPDPNSPIRYRDIDINEMIRPDDPDSVGAQPFYHTRDAIFSSDLPDKGKPGLDTELNLGKVVFDLTQGKLDRDDGAHLDPDLNPNSLSRKSGWRPLFGQTGAAQGHLRNLGVGPGDLFLFYGWFRWVKFEADRLIYVVDAPDLHIIFGWLQVSEIIELAANSAPSWAEYHPHVQHAFKRNNVLYMATDWLNLPKVELAQDSNSRQNGNKESKHVSDGRCMTTITGAGLFPFYHRRLQLTAPGHLRSIWTLPHWFWPDKRPPLSYHSRVDRWQQGQKGVQLRTVGRGQEFVLDCEYYPEAIEWVKELFSQQTLS